ncbi:hypothetical protein HELRODRAFT_166874 [Helobdella robusta]|uniref:Uncharacterized protein n=1 Tax=Helobdella robusta TaxID=6412 RepID=T1EYP1_HELRO|nr:hypothetical protein HELRODRAFT_166874 [Helobdella robusta]ESO11821.1 hypothetical protein HELRODRAFT_166874 [Helobdella robusta]
MTVDPQKVFFIVNDAGQPTPVQFLKNGIPTLISVSNPIVSRLHQGRISGEGVQFYNENGEIDCGVQVDTYIFFADEDNKFSKISKLCRHYDEPVVHLLTVAHCVITNILTKGHLAKRAFCQRDILPNDILPKRHFSNGNLERFIWGCD